MPLRFQDQVAIVTGGGGGIGGATCRRLAQEGACVMVVDLVEANARRVAEAITEAGGPAAWHAANLTELPAAEGMAAATLERYGRIDVLVNTAGGSAGPAIQSTPKDFAHSDPARWQEMITLNLVGTLTPTRAVVKYADHLPLYRQEAIFGRAGFAIPRSTLGAWVGSCGVRLQPLVDALRQEVLAHRVLHPPSRRSQRRS